MDRVNLQNQIVSSIKRKEILYSSTCNLSLLSTQSFLLHLIVSIKSPVGIMALCGSSLFLQEAIDFFSVCFTDYITQRNCCFLAFAVVLISTLIRGLVFGIQINIKCSNTTGDFFLAVSPSLSLHAALSRYMYFFHILEYQRKLLLNCWLFPFSSSFLIVQHIAYHGVL